MLNNGEGAGLAVKCVTPSTDYSPGAAARQEGRCRPLNGATDFRRRPSDDVPTNERLKCPELFRDRAPPQ